ncbi:hypothetical protein KY320_04175 [Candidatus Woesearchaeota archaeon]|nr:hypothetical protein [Candidatus Woesearchaeota archaeon]
MANKKRLREAMEDVEYEDLLKLDKDLSSGGLHLKKLVAQKLHDIESEQVKLCATCGTSINPYFIDDFTLTFGRRDFRKRAHFCGTDCLKYFLNSLESEEKNRLKTKPTESF